MREIIFQCKKCGRCCTHLIQQTEYALLGLYLQPNEIQLFPAEFIKPMYGCGTKGRSRPRPAKIIVYQFATEPCPHYSKEEGCRIYDKRPLICRSFPFEPFAASRECPVIKSQVTPNEPFRTKKESILGEIDANSQHLKYLKPYLREGLDWIFDLKDKHWHKKTSADDRRFFEKNPELQSILQENVLAHQLRALEALEEEKHNAKQT